MTHEVAFMVVVDELEPFNIGDIEIEEETDLFDDLLMDKFDKLQLAEHLEKYVEMIIPNNEVFSWNTVRDVAYTLVKYSN
jgi:acyl carrier protein